MKSRSRSKASVVCPECKAKYGKKGARHSEHCRIAELQRIGYEVERVNVELGKEW